METCILFTELGDPNKDIFIELLQDNRIPFVARSIDDHPRESITPDGVSFVLKNGRPYFLEDIEALAMAYEMDTWVAIAVGQCPSPANHIDLKISLISEEEGSSDGSV